MTVNGSVDLGGLGGGGGGGGSGIQSINGDTTSAQIIAAGTGISVATVAGTTTITNTGTSFSVPEVATDPVSPTAGQMWVLYTAGTAAISHSLAAIALLMPSISGSTYQLSYRTTESTTVRVTLT